MNFLITNQRIKDTGIIEKNDLSFFVHALSYFRTLSNLLILDKHEVDNWNRHVMKLNRSAGYEIMPLKKYRYLDEEEAGRRIRQDEYH